MLKMSLILFVAGILSANLIAFAADGPPPTGEQKLNKAEADFSALHGAYLTRYRPLVLESEQAWWQANTTGTDEAFARRRTAEEALIELHSDRDTFAKLKSLKESGQVADPVLARQLDVMYRAFLARQADPDLQKKIVALETETEQIFNTHRSLVNGKELTENDVRKILIDSDDSALTEAAWNGYMKVGAKVEGKLGELVRLRNQVARQLGFDNYYVMQLTLQELDVNELLQLFDELNTLTRDAFAAFKTEFDAARAARFKVAPADLRPWHYGELFFQELPGGSDVNLDALFADRDLVELSRTYYASMGMSVDDILARSDLYEKPGKSPHAFSADLDRAGDVRVLCNLRPNLYWADTILHELGHAVYDKYIAPDVPFDLHNSSHGLTTEGIAMMLGSMCKNEDWLTTALRLDEDDAARLVAAARRTGVAEKLVFCRWAQVMVRFERGMYADPDQDLGRLWWNLKKRYQLLNPPDDPSRPDYGAKMHIVGSPAYYHNYMLGDLFACQVHEHIAREVLGLNDPEKTSFYGSKAAGDFMRRTIFAPGNLLAWRDLTVRATGEPLSAKAFARRCVRAPNPTSSK
ncbi:MAG TPA: M2 family metallopeptidase [Phycisphaerae bacterium]|nr:M2 family metallopeptidase [Phycisphaerae bacterium]